MGEPLLAGDGGRTHTFRAGVIFVENGPPPVDHLALYIDGTRGGCMNRNAMGGESEPRSHVSWKLEHPHEHRRNPLAVRHAMPFNEFESERCVELLHDDRGAS